MDNLKPMGAVSALYAPGQHELATAIVARLSDAIFVEDAAKPAGAAKIFLAHVSHKVVRWTTRAARATDATGGEVALYKNRLFERSGHPYAQALLTSSSGTTAAFVEGGDPMNGPYMMIAPEIRKNGGLWDRIFFDSVQSKDVQLRFVHETRATYQAAQRVLDRGESVRIKAVAAGTGLSLILAYDKLIRDGYEPRMITAVISDRDPANTEKTHRLLEKLPTTRADPDAHGILAVTEDLLDEPDPPHEPYDVVTAVGIFEYFQGGAHTTTEARLMLHEPEEPFTAHHLAARLGEMTTDRGGRLIVNTYRDHSCIRILELFGKRFDFRDRSHLRDLLAPQNFRTFHLAGSGHIYDVEVFEKFISAPDSQP